MTRASRLFTPKSQVSPVTGVPISNEYAKATKVNEEGFPAFERTLEEDTLSVLLCNTLSDTFYASQRDIADKTIDVLTAMAKKDPAFLSKALVYARNKGLMKMAPVVGLAILSVYDGSGKPNFWNAFDHVVRIPDDLREFVDLCCSGKIRKGLGGVSRDAVKHWLRSMSQYHAVKYGSAKSEGVTLRDILRMSHPHPKDRAQEELFGWLVKGWDSVGAEPSPTNSLVWALEKVKRSTDEAEIIGLVQKYKLPWEVVVPSVKKMTVGIWKALLGGMPYMALLRNLATMERHGVLADKEVVKDVVERLSKPENVRKSKQLPFRFFNAFHAFNGNQAVRDALTDALEASFENMEKLEGRVCISNDVSGSMGGRASNRGAARYCDIAGLFAAALFKKCDDVVLLPFDTEVYHPKVSRRDSVMSLAEKVGMAMGGTDLAAPINCLIDGSHKVDVFIGITDGMDWADEGFLTAWKRYKKVSPKAKAILVRIDPYAGEWNSPKGYPDVYYVMGWSDAVVKYIPLVVKGIKTQVDDVRKMDLSEFGKVAKPAEEVETPQEA
jgi:60 kDa SS-A/Ro ribonucleoprotein